MKEQNMIMYQKKRYQEMSERLESIISNRIASGRPVSVRGVATDAGVQRITIYRHDEIMDLIRHYRSA